MNTLYPRGIEVVVGVFVKYKNKYFLAKSPKWNNVWIVPGGHIEPGETIFECAIRESKEETGLDIIPQKIIRSFELINPPTFFRKGHVVAFHILSTTRNDTVILDNDELSEYKWLTKKEALKLNNLSNTTIESFEFLE